MVSALLIASATLAMSCACLGADEDPSVRMSLRGDAPEGQWETYTRRPTGLLLQQLSLRAGGAQQTYPGLEPVNAALEQVMRAEGLLPRGEYGPRDVPTLASGKWAKIPEDALEPVKRALVDYFRAPEVHGWRRETAGQKQFIAKAENMVRRGYSRRRDEWEKISFWTIHTFVVASELARGFLASEDPQQRARFAREFRDWVIAYAGQSYYRFIPDGSKLGPAPHVWGDQWHMERSTRAPTCFFSFLAPDVRQILSAPVEEFGGDPFDLWFLKFALDQIVKADGFVQGYRGGNHGWFQINAAVSLALNLPEFKVAQPTLENALRRAAEHCIDDNRLDGWHRESTLSYMSTYIAHEDAVLRLLDRHEKALKDRQARAGMTVAPYVKIIRDTVTRQRRAELCIRFPNQSQPAFGDCAGSRGSMPDTLQTFRSNALSDVGVYLMRTGWEKQFEGKEHVGLAFNAMPRLAAHNCSDLLGVMLSAYGAGLLHKPPTYRYENSEHWYKRCTQSTNTATVGDFAEDSLAPEQFGKEEMYGAAGTSWGPWPGNTFARRPDQTGPGDVLGWRGTNDNCARLLAWAPGPQVDFVEACHDRYVFSPERPWPTGERPFGPRIRRSVLFVHSSAGGVGPYAIVTDTFTNPTPQALAGDYHDLNVLYHMPVETDWREKGVPWETDPATKAVRTRYEDTANLTIAPADPERLTLHRPIGLWSRRVREGESPGSLFGSRFSYTVPYIVYALPGDPAPVPDCIQTALYPDRASARTELRVTRIPVTPSSDLAEAAAVQVEFPALGVRDIFFVAGSPGTQRRFGEGSCDGGAAWVRLQADAVLASAMVNGDSLSWGEHRLSGKRRRGTVASAMATTEEGYVVAKLTLDDPALTEDLVGRAITLRDGKGRLLTSYNVSRVLGPHTVLLSETRRTNTWVNILRVDQQSGKLQVATSGDGLSPGSTLQIFQDGAVHLLRVEGIDGDLLSVAAPDGSPADLGPLAGHVGHRMIRVYEAIPSGCAYEITTSTWSGG